MTIKNSKLQQKERRKEITIGDRNDDEKIEITTTKKKRNNDKRSK